MKTLAIALLSCITPLHTAMATTATGGKACTPDAICCRPTPGGSSCHVESLRCLAPCKVICASGYIFNCGSIEFTMDVCRHGRPFPNEAECFEVNPINCIDFYPGTDPCSIIGCDQDAVNAECMEHTLP